MMKLTEVQAKPNDFITTAEGDFFRLLYSYKRGYALARELHLENLAGFTGLSAILISVAAKESSETFSKLVPLKTSSYLGASLYGCDVLVNSEHFQPFVRDTISGLSVVNINEVPNGLYFMSTTGNPLIIRGGALDRRI